MGTWSTGGGAGATFTCGGVVLLMRGKLSYECGVSCLGIKQHEKRCTKKLKKSAPILSVSILRNKTS